LRAWLKKQPKFLITFLIFIRYFIITFLRKILSIAPLLEKVDSMCPKFQVFRDTSGKTRFRIRSDNNQIVAIGEACDHSACIKAITSVLSNRNAAVTDLTVNTCSDAPNPKFEIYFDQNHKYRFRLRGVDGGVIAQGEAYDTRGACLTAIEVVRCCYNASVEDPFATEIVLEDELPITPQITISVVNPTDVVVSFGDQQKHNLPSFPVVSMFTLLGLQLAAGLPEGVFCTVGKSKQEADNSTAAS
jgi:uncharacterized protein YegP (UPF0339 family)